MPDGDADARAVTVPEDHRGGRGIRSYVLRQGRMTAGQRRAMSELLGRHGIALSADIDWVAAFGNERPVTLEIGFGMGESLLAMAVACPERNFVGVEVHAPGVGHLLARIEETGINNLKVVHGDVMAAIDHMTHDSLAHIQIFFPDPWHKKKHHKRRLINPAFVGRIVELMGDGALLHIATDWEPYATAISEVMAGFPQLRPCDVPWRPETKYESRGLRLGHRVTDVCYRKALI